MLKEFIRNKMKINFYEPIHGDYLQYVVMICHYQGKWVFCQHHTRQTLELPGGHREEGEDNLTAAKRELYEETGAIQYHIKPLCEYSVVDDNQKESFGMLYDVEILELESQLHYEIAKVVLMDELPKHWTYPDIQPYLIQHYQMMKENG